MTEFNLDDFMNSKAGICLLRNLRMKNFYEEVRRETHFSKEEEQIWKDKYFQQRVVIKDLMKILNYFTDCNYSISDKADGYYLKKENEEVRKLLDKWINWDEAFWEQ